jgi:hypothetical protein
LRHDFWQADIPGPAPPIQLQIENNRLHTPRSAQKNAHELVVLVSQFAATGMQMKGP